MILGMSKSVPFEREIRRCKGHILLMSTLLVLFLFVLSGLSVVGANKKANAEGMTISPVLQRINLKPGETLTQSFRLTNPDDVETRFHVFATPYSVTGEEYTQDFVSPSAMTEVSKWIHFDQITYVAKPKETLTIPYSVEVPNSAHGGGQYATIMCETDAPEVNGSGVAELQRIALMIYGTVEGDITISGKLQSEQIESGIKIGNSVETSFKIQNTGNVEMLVPHRVVVTNKLTGAIISEPEDSNASTLPNTIRALKDRWEAISAVGLYDVKQEITVAGKMHTTDKTVLLISAPVAIVFSIVLLLVLFLVVSSVVRKRALNSVGIRQKLSFSRFLPSRLGKRKGNATGYATLIPPGTTPSLQNGQNIAQGQAQQPMYSPNNPMGYGYSPPNIQNAQNAQATNGSQNAQGGYPGDTTGGFGYSPQNLQENTGGQFGYTQPNGYTPNQAQANQALNQVPQNQVPQSLTEGSGIYQTGQVPQSLTEGSGIYQTGQVPQMSPQTEFSQVLQNQVPLGQTSPSETQPTNEPSVQAAKNSIEEEALKLEKLKLELRQQELLLKEKELRFRSGGQEDS